MHISGLLYREKVRGLAHASASLGSPVDNDHISTGSASMRGCMKRQTFLLQAAFCPDSMHVVALKEPAGDVHAMRLTISRCLPRRPGA